MQALMDEDLAILRKIEDPAEVIKKSSQMRQIDWGFLRGDYANVLVAGEREMQRIHYALKKKMAAAVDTPAQTPDDDSSDKPASKPASSSHRP